MFHFCAVSQLLKVNLEKKIGELVRNNYGTIFADRTLGGSEKK